jgi:hypothetical protein
MVNMEASQEGSTKLIEGCPYKKWIYKELKLHYSMG